MKQLLLALVIGAVGFSSQCAMTIGMQKNGWRCCRCDSSCCGSWCSYEEKSATASLVRQSLCPVFALVWQGLFFPEERLSWTSFAGMRVWELRHAQAS